MFSAAQKREISDKVQQILRDTAHPDLPEGEIVFVLLVEGADEGSYANIRNNGSGDNLDINPCKEVVIESMENL